MNKSMLAAAAAAFFIGAASLSGGSLKVTAATAANASSNADLRDSKLRAIYRRQPRAQDLIAKVEAKIIQLKSQPATAGYGSRLAKELNYIEVSGPGESEARLKEDVDLLEAAANASINPPATEQLASLQERYGKLVSALDDTILVKDYERLLPRHDRLIRYTAAGLWDRDKIAAELQKMEDMLATAPDIAYGRSEVLRGLQNRRLVAVNQLVYLGVYPHEEAFLSPHRRSAIILEENLGSRNQIETADLTIQNPDGTFIDMTTANNPACGIPFSPPLSLWMKSRMLEGRVPAITFRLSDNKTIAQFAGDHPDTKYDTGKLSGVQDVLDGKLDDYFKRNIAVIADTKEAAIVGLFDNFDRELSANAFGANGKTPFYMFDPKLSNLPAEDARQEFLKRNGKGIYISTKSVWPELSNQYGDPNIPDGPERVKDAWKHLRQVIGNANANIAYYSTAGAFHGSKTAYKSPELADAGTQAWNKLEYYWPGEGILDWVGVEAVGSVPAENPKGPNILESVEQFFFETRTSAWQQTPAILRGVGPGSTANPLFEAAWIATVFQKMIKATYPSISIVFVDSPEKLTLWSNDAAAAYRTNVASDKFYEWPLRFKMLSEEKK